MLEVESYVVSGYVKTSSMFETSRSNHSWNIVKFNNFYYFIDVSKALKNHLNFFEEEEDIPFHIRRRYYFFTKPEVLLMTHYPEEDCYSLLEGYKFSYQKAIEMPIITPYLKIKGL